VVLCALANELNLDLMLDIMWYDSKSQTGNRIIMSTIQLKTINGVLEAFAETGTEGILWSVHEQGVQGYDGLNVLKNGDYLIILDKKESDKVIWEGYIELDYQINYRPYPMNPQYGQQAIGNFWVHGVQKDFNPDKWLQLFMQENPVRLTIAPELT
jgi:hypothetical protein